MIQYPRYRQHRFSSFQVIIAGFAAVDLVGAFLLMLPIAAQQRYITPFHEALFTSTSALCVTGLVVQDTGSYWSAFGQSVILLLIQIGKRIQNIMGLTYIKSRFLHPVKMKWYDLQIEIIGAWKFFLKRQRSGERKLTKIHYQSTDKICGNKRSTVIYMANGYTWHGGLADRLKGIVSLYAWCSDHSKPFKINFCHPFRLHNYLIPNEYDWQIADEDISYNPCEVAVKQCLIAPVLAVPTVQPRLPELLGDPLYHRK